MEGRIDSGTKFHWSVIIALDGCGIGALPHAAQYGDTTEHL